MSPTALFSLAEHRVQHLSVLGWPGGVYPGWGVGGWAGRAIPGYYPAMLPGPIFNINLASGPTYGQMKGFSDYSMRFLR